MQFWIISGIIYTHLVKKYPYYNEDKRNLANIFPIPYTKNSCLVFLIVLIEIVSILELFFSIGKLSLYIKDLKDMSSDDVTDQNYNMMKYSLFTFARNFARKQTDYL